MKTIISFIAAMGLLAGGPVYAQTAVAGSGSQSSSGAAAGAGAAASSPVNIGNNSPVYAHTPSDVIVRSAPTIYAPNVVTGNVCALGASGGASWLGTGIVFGGSWESEQCERRQKAALLYNSGHHQAAAELQCDDKGVYMAMRRSGDTTCGIRPEWEPKPQAVQAGNVVTEVKPVAPASAPALPANCMTQTVSGQTFVTCR